MNEMAASPDVCEDLAWSEWIPFKPGHPRRSDLPKGSGFILIRPVGTELPVSFTLANSGLVNTFGMIVQYREKRYEESGPPIVKDNPAACLWRLRLSTGVEFEYSYAMTSYDGYSKRAAGHVRSCHLAEILREYRVRNGHSPLCNFIEMEPDLVLTGMMRNISSPGLRLKGDPVDLDWMGLDWCEPFLIGERRFTHRDAGWMKVIYEGEVTYIGKQQHLHGVIVPRSPEVYGEGAMISVALHDASMPKYQVAEVWSDLLGGFFATEGRVPRMQFGALGEREAPKLVLSKVVLSKLVTDVPLVADVGEVMDVSEVMDVPLVADVSEVMDVSEVTGSRGVSVTCEYGWEGY
ncbi:MAG TPA: hypothetical protein O0X66_00695 [Methanocorpusculum sp.]|nr:hypothetical protein [Methanocorpusculum sp.]HJJ53010.1 hypothetical protein [Methanocorpusculum sp.]